MQEQKYSQNEIRLVRMQICLWKLALACYLRDFNEGVRLYDEMEKLCCLCPLYQKHTFKYIDGSPHQLLSCRRCPIVRATGHTCAHMRVEHGFEKDWHLSKERAVIGVRLVIKRLENVIKIMGARKRQGVGIGEWGVE